MATSSWSSAAWSPGASSSSSSRPPSSGALDAGVAQTAQDVDQLQRDRGLCLGGGDGQVKRCVAVPVQTLKTVVRGHEELFDLACVEVFHGVVHFQGGGE